MGSEIGNTPSFPLSPDLPTRTPKTSSAIPNGDDLQENILTLKSARSQEGPSEYD